ncbi:UNVERIFIED_CONTAM: hypothetical protein Scaly_2609900 [Sesamum calycinum]|uniref:DUF4283 domain-containing protein n=1 Tax=Sesamum calycinum TaxID=2727403 RepID=A0AAW2JC69_9LAMI
MRVFKWIPCFDPQIESSVAPVWIRLPNLPAHLFEKNALFTLAAKIERPLRMDEPTADQSRPDLARVCVELDLTSPRVQAVGMEFIKMAICFVELTTDIERDFNVTTKCPGIERLTREVGLRISLVAMKPTPKGRSGTFQVKDLEIGHRGSYGDLH